MDCHSNVVTGKFHRGGVGYPFSRMPRRRLTEEQIQEIITSPLSIRQLSEKLGHSYHTIWYCRNNRGGQRKRSTGYFKKGQHHHCAKLTDEQVREIYQMEGSTFEISCDYDVSVPTIWNIRAGRTWRHITEGLKSGYKPKGRWNKSREDDGHSS